MDAENELVYDQGLVKAVFDEALERAAAIADSYMTIESRAIAEDIRSLKKILSLRKE